MFHETIMNYYIQILYQTFHFDHGDVIFDQAHINSFHESLESLQYNTSLTITGAIRGTSKETLYQELRISRYLWVTTASNHLSYVLWNIPLIKYKSTSRIYLFFILNILQKLFSSFCNNWMEPSRQIYSKFRKSEYF